MICDLSVTLIGQSKRSWQGRYDVAAEAAPHGAWLLRRHPLLFIGAFALYLLGVFIALRYLPRRLARIAAVALAIGHFWGFNSWVFYRFRANYYVLRFLCIVFSSLLVYHLERPQAQEAAHVSLLDFFHQIMRDLPLFALVVFK